MRLTHIPIVCMESSMRYLGSLEGLAIFHLQVSPSTSDEHSHPRAHLYIPTGGKLAEYAALRTTEWTGDNIELRPPGFSHSFVAKSPTNLIAICFEPWRYERMAAAFGDGASISTRLLQGSARRVRLAMEERNRVAATSLVAARALEVVACVELLQAGSGEAGVAGRAVDYMLQHLASDLTPDSIARGIGVPKEYLTRRFRTVMGAPLMQHLRALRTEQAVARVLSTDQTLKQIATECGFFDQSHMSRVILKSTGRTPASFRGDNGRRVRPRN